MSRHDPHLTSLTYNPRTIPTYHPTLTLTSQRLLNHDLISLRDSFGDGDDQGDLVGDGFEDGGGGEGWRDVDDGSVGFDFGDGL